MGAPVRWMEAGSAKLGVMDGGKSFQYNMGQVFKGHIRVACLCEERNILHRHRRRTLHGGLAVQKGNTGFPEKKGWLQSTVVFVCFGAAFVLAFFLYPPRLCCVLCLCLIREARLIGNSWTEPSLSIEAHFGTARERWSEPQQQKKSVEWACMAFPFSSTFLLMFFLAVLALASEVVGNAISSETGEPCQAPLDVRGYCFGL